MTSQTTLDTKISTPTLPSPRSSELPNIGSLTVTDVLNGNNLQGPEKNSADVMQDLQRQQTQPVIVQALSPSRVNTSVEDDLNALLDETLDEFSMSFASSSSSLVQSTAVSSLSSVLHANDCHVAIIENLLDMETLLVTAASLGAVADLGAIDWMSSFTTGSTDEMAKTVQQINKTIEMINLCFKSLLQSDNPSTWLEQESKTPFYRNCHLFAASYFLQETSLLNLLDSKLIAEWKDNYQNCVILLKKYSLDQYNETEFPFSWENKLCINMIKGMSNNDAVKNGVAKMTQDPQFQEMMKRDFIAFNEDPEKMMSQMMTPNPQQMGALGNGDPMAMMAEMAQNPQFAEMMKGQAEAFGKGGFAGSGTMLELQIQPLISFFQELDQVLTQNSENAEAVEKWLNEVKLTYQHPFFRSKSLLMRLPVDSSTSKLQLLSEICCKRLSTLGLQKYVDEAPPKQAMDILRQMAVQQKENLQHEVSMSLSFLRPLSIELKKLNFTSEECSANRQVIEDWMTRCKQTESYYAPFVIGLDLCEYREAFEEVLDKELLDELTQLLPFCREKLLKLGLSTYVFEMPQIQESNSEPKADRARDRIG